MKLPKIKISLRAIMIIFVIIMGTFSAYAGISQSQGGGFFIGTPTNTLTDGLVGHWTFDGPDMQWSNTGAEVRDLSGNNNHGSLEGSLSQDSVAIGKIGQALSFDGVGDYIYIGSSDELALPAEMTLSAWVKINKTGSQIIIMNNTNYMLATRVGDIRLSLWLDGTCCSFPHSQADIVGKWTHIAVTATTDGYIAKAYVNGEEIGQAYPEGDWPYSMGPLNIGRYSWSDGGGYLDGQIDDVRIYNRVLTEAEIEQLYQMGERRLALGSPSNSQTDGLVGHWTFDGRDMQLSNTGAEVRDLSGNNNHGSLEGSLSQDSVAIGKIGQALSFDGVSDYVDMGDVLDMGLNDWTVSAWVKLSNPPKEDYNAVVAKSKAANQPNRYSSMVKVTNGEGFAGVYLRGEVEDPSVEFVGSIPVTSGEWHLVSFVFKRDAHVSIYVDGVFDDSRSMSHWENVDMQSDFNFVIGVYDFTTTNVVYRAAFSGLIDDVRIYNRALTEAEIEQLYRQGSGRSVVKP